MSPNDLDQFLRPSPGIQCDHPEVIALAEKVSGGGDPVERAARLFDFSRDTVRYSVYEPFWEIEDYWALNTLARGKGYCAQKAALLTALARAVGIPARIAYAHIRNYQLPDEMVRSLGDNVLHYHTYVQWHLNGRWLAATPSFDRKLCADLGWRLVEFVPDRDLMLPALDTRGRPHIDYVAKLGWRPGIMLDEMLTFWRTLQGGRRIKVWMAAVKTGKSFGQVNQVEEVR
jgi:transglutaminase-like putative cysteine protease